MNKQSMTDWDRLAKTTDEEIDLTDIPELDDEFFTNAHLRIPGKKSVTIRLDEDVLEWFKKQGKGYQTRINKLLRGYMESQT